MSLTIRSPPLRQLKSTTIAPIRSGAGHDGRISSRGESVAGTSSCSSASSSSANSAPSSSSPPSPPRSTRLTTSSKSSSGSAPIHTLQSLSHFTEPVKRIILLRNGRSEANEDVSAYVRTPDWRIPLVEEGKRECVRAGRQLAQIIGDEPVYFYYSPYIRSRQSLRYVLQGYDEGRQECRDATDWWESEDMVPTTAHCEGESMPASPSSRPSGTGSATSPFVGASSSSPPPSPSSTASNGVTVDDEGEYDGDHSTVMDFHPTHVNQLSDTSLVLRHGSSDCIIGVREDVRLRDGDIGRYTSTQELLYHLEERERYGKFFYRFPHGESGADVCDRVTSFLDAFQRERVEFPMDTNVIIITHGLTMRMFVKRWFHLTVDTFHKMLSPPSGSMCTLTRLHHRSCFRLDESCVETMRLPLSLNESNGYKYRNKQLLGSMSTGAPYM